ncbi:MAG: hypothetical protein AAGA77_18905 [Bacteroidota bacterium]
MKYILPALGLFFIALFALVLRPVHIPENPDDCLVAKGKVIGIYEAGEHDVVFKLEDSKTRYYINRGLEQGLVLKELQKKLIGNTIVIRYPKHWTPLDPNNTTKHLSILEFEGQELYNEIDLIHNR